MNAIPVAASLASRLHHIRLDAVTRELLAAGARSVADLGCGGCALLQKLRRYSQFTHLVGVDNDTRSLARARANLDLDPLRGDERLRVVYGSFDEDLPVAAVDAAVMLETIEHVDPRRLSRVERAIFHRLGPGQVLITTPNREYNSVHGLSAGERRHPGHRFEWSRAQFRRWCGGVAGRAGYLVRYIDIGPPHPELGSSTQMASFTSRAA